MIAKKGGYCMDHREYIRYIKGSANAVLLIHGIAGTPAHFRDLIPVIPEDCSVYNILLDGHGADADAFSATSMEKWKAQVSTTLALLLTRHQSIIIAAHSMGTLFAIQEAIRHPDRVKALFLLAVPTRPWVRLRTIPASFRVVWGNLSSGDILAQAMQADCSIRHTRKLWKYLGWLPRLWELLAEIRKVRAMLHQLQTPTSAFQSRADELVSFRSYRDLAPLPAVRCTVLENSCHFCYSESDLRLLQKSFKELLHIFLSPPD